MAKKEREAAGRAITRAVLALPEYREARVLMAYASMPSEPDTRELIDLARAAGKTVLLPVCLDRERMTAGVFAGWERLAPGRMGIPEPERGKPGEDAPEPELILVPCVAADRNGGRLGHGAGYYDRFLRGRRGRTVCLCFDCCLADEIPMTAEDVRMDCVLTERGLFRPEQNV